MATLFADYPGALENTMWVAGRCSFELDSGVQELLRFPTPPGAPAYLTYLCQMTLRMPDRDRVRRRAHLAAPRRPVRATRWSTVLPSCEHDGYAAVADLEQCRAGQHVRVARLAVVMQAPPTANGYRFLTLEDEFGLVNGVVRQYVCQVCRQVLCSHTLLLLDGICQCEGGTINVLLETATPLVREFNRKTSPAHVDG